VTQKDWQQWASLQIIPHVNDPSENKEKACRNGGNHDTKCWEKARKENNATTYHMLHERNKNNARIAPFTDAFILSG
jgi:hypothetical protein